MGKINIVFDASMFDTFIACPTKYDFRYNLNKTTPQKAPPLDKGEIIHVGFESYYKSIQAHKPFEVSLDAALISARTALATDSDLSTEDGNLVLNTIEENLIYWRIEDQGFVIDEVEKAFALVLYEDEIFRIVWIGKIDLMTSDNRYENRPIDHKSYSRDFPVHRKTNQFCGYSFAAKSNYLLVNRVGLQKSLKAHEKFKRVPLSFDPIFHEQWKQNVIKWCMRYYDCIQDNDWPLNDTSCDKYNRLCEYYEICDTTGAENKTYKLDVNFKTGTPWDVSKVLQQDQ